MQRRSNPDEWLMRQTAQGDRESLEVIVRRYASPLLTFIRRMVGDEHRSEELFQEVFLAIWRKRHQYDWERPFRPWLYRIAINCCRADFRKKVLPAVDVQEQECVLTGARESSYPAPIDTAIATETSTRVAQAVRCLPEQQRTVVALRIWQNLPYAEIASIIGCNEVTARSHMHIALLNLRKHLAPYVMD